MLCEVVYVENARAQGGNCELCSQVTSCGTVTAPADDLEAKYWLLKLKDVINTERKTSCGRLTFSVDISGA